MTARIDLEIARTWADMGIVPENHSSREHAAKVIAKLLAERDALHAVLATARWHDAEQLARDLGKAP